MSQTFRFLKRHWLTLALLVASIFGVRWYVGHNRAPGSMTVVESQAMDMTQMRPPVGVMPVSIEEVKSHPITRGKSFAATVVAFAEEEIVARIPGRVVRMLVYPGDQVIPGQLLATIEAPEYEAELRKAQSMAGAKSAEVISAEREIEHHRNILMGANAAIKSAQSVRTRVQIDAEASLIELEKAKAELSAKSADKEERDSELAYADKELVRQRAIYAKGAISLDELQASERERNSAAARVKAAVAEVIGASQSVRVAEKRVKSANQMVTEAEAQLAVATSGAKQAEEGIQQAHADAKAKRFEASASRADTSAAATFADYRQLRALSSGIVSERLVSPGTAVSSGQVILRTKSVGEVRVQAELPQSLSGSISVGAKVLVDTESAHKEGKITSIFPSVDPVTRTFRVEAQLVNREGELKPGMFATLTLAGAESTELAVRTEAIQSDDTGSFVWTAITRPMSGKVDWTCSMHPEISKPGPGKCPICDMDLTMREKGGSLMAHRQAVASGKSGGGYSEILSGLSEGEKVIWKGFENLIEGTPVQSAEQSEKPVESSKQMEGSMPRMDHGSGAGK